MSVKPAASASVRGLVVLLAPQARFQTSERDELIGELEEIEAAMAIAPETSSPAWFDDPFETFREEPDGDREA